MEDMSILELLGKGLLDTAIGMGIVFILLILIAIIIHLLQYLNPEYTSKNTQTNQIESGQGSVLDQVEDVQRDMNEMEDERVDDGELVAVIMSAIAASMNTSSDQLIVRSIKRVKSH